MLEVREAFDVDTAELRPDILSLDISFELDAIGGNESIPQRSIVPLHVRRPARAPRDSMANGEPKPSFRVACDRCILLRVGVARTERVILRRIGCEPRPGGIVSDARFIDEPRKEGGGR